LTLYFSILTFPDLLYNLGFRNILVLSVVQLNAQIYLHLATIAFVIIPLKMLGVRKIERMFLVVLFLSLLFTIFVSFYWFEPSTLMVKGNFFHLSLWREKPWLRAKDGIVLGFSSLFATFFFFVKGFRSSVDFVKKKSLLLGIGITGLTLAAFVNYIGGAVPKFWVLVLASLFAIFGMCFVWWGAVYQKTQKKI